MKNLYSTAKLIAVLLVLLTLNVQVIAQEYIIAIAGNVITTADNSNSSDLLLVLENANLHYYFN